MHLKHIKLKGEKQMNPWTTVCGHCTFEESQKTLIRGASSIPIETMSAAIDQWSFEGKKVIIMQTIL